MKTRIVIPTYNRAHCLRQAVESSLNQSHEDIELLIVDDGSSDTTRQLLDPYLNDNRVSYVRLRTNGGTAQAKNVGLMLGSYDAITFHDSDDIFARDKVLLQTRALQLQCLTDEILDWKALDVEPGQTQAIDIAVGAHEFIKNDGSVHIIDNRISLVDDFFPNLQMPNKTEGDWILINSGLFRRRCFEELGGFFDSVEEDRELRNRFIAAGYLFHFINHPLLTKVEMATSLTTNEDTGYQGETRKRDRDKVWERNRAYREAGMGDRVAEIATTPIDLTGIAFSEVVENFDLEPTKDIPSTKEGFSSLKRAFDQARLAGEGGKVVEVAVAGDELKLAS